MKKLIISLFLLSSLSAYGQKNFRDGFIIKQLGDTTFGQVAYRNNKTSALITHFRTTKSGEVQAFKPDDLEGFGYVGEKYMESKLLGVIDNREYKVFVEIIFKGKISLYRYKNDYILEKENVLYLITNRELIELNLSEKILVYSDNDVKTIAELVSDCTHAVIDQSGFKIVDKHLIQVLEIYHQCINGDYQIFKEDKPWTNVRFGFFGGTNSSKLEFKSDNVNNQFLDQTNFGNARSLFIGFEVNISSPRVTDAYELMTGLQFIKTNFYGFSEIPISGGIERNDLWINLEKMVVPLGLRYNFRDKGFSPYLGFGMNFSINYSLAIERLSETLSNGLVLGNENSIPFETKTTQFGLWGAFGLTIPVNTTLDGFLEIKFEKSNGIVKTGALQNATLDSSISGFQVLMGLRF